MSNDHNDKHTDDESRETEYHHDPLQDEAIDEAIEEAIDEVNEEAIKDAISECLEFTFVKKGCRMLTREPVEELSDEPEEEIPQHQEKQRVGSEGSGQRHHYTGNDNVKADKEYSQPTGPSMEPTKREKLEALRAGLSEFVNKERAVLDEKIRDSEENSTYFSDDDKFYHERNISTAQDKLLEIESALRNSPDDESIDYSALPEWQRDLVRAEERNKEAKLDNLRSLAAEGINIGDARGSEALGKLTQNQDELIRDARKKSEEAI